MRNGLNGLLKNILRVALLWLALVPTGAEEDLGEDLNRRYDQNTYLTTHNAYANKHDHYSILTANQRYGIKEQLDDGVRCLAMDIYMMRQKISKDLFGIPTRYIFERYTSRGDYLNPSEEFEDEDAGIALAHEPDKWGYILFEDAGLILRPFQSLYEPLTEIKEWLDDHLNEVVTITFESRVYEPSGLWSYFQAAELDNMVFYADRPNPGFLGPDNTPWNVPVHGWPPLKEMVYAGKRLVLFSDDGVEWVRYSGQPIGGPSTTDDDGLPNYWNFVVENNYGDASIEDVDQKRSASEVLSDLRFALTAMNWFPDANVQGPDMGGGHDPSAYLWNYGSLNSYDEVSTARNKFAAAAGRYPNFISVDYYHKGGDGGPRRVVRDCNTYWANRPKVTATITVTPPPNIYGWRKDAQVVARALSGHSYSNIRQINYYWHGGNDILGHSESSVSTILVPVTIRLSNGRETDTPFLGRTNDGVFRVSAEGVSIGGDRSDRAVTWVKVDGTPPNVQAKAMRLPDNNGWYNRPLTIEVEASDLLSRARSAWWVDWFGRTNYSENFTSEVTNQFIKRTFNFDYEQEGSVFVQFSAEDFAGNVSATNSGFIEIKLDRTPPVTIVSGFTHGATTRTVVLNATDTLSGADRTWYQLNSDQSWTPYEQPITLPSASEQTLRFYSADVAGNMESFKTFRIGQTAVSLSTARNPAGYFQALDITAIVRASETGPKPTGTVTFLDGTNVMATVSLDTNGIARTTLTPINYRLARGSHQLTARYDGNSSFSPTTSEVLIQNVIDPPGVIMTSSASRVVETQPVTLTATVFSSDEQIPTGTVTFYVRNGVSGREVLGVAVPLGTNGTATLTTDQLAVGYYILFANYDGDASFPPADSGSAKELVVDEAVVSLFVVTEPNPSRYGEPVTFRMTPAAPTDAPLTGSIRIEENDSAIDTVLLDGTNTITYTTSSLEEGEHNFLLHLNTSSRLQGSEVHKHHVTAQLAPAPTFRDVAAAPEMLELSIDALPGRGVQVEYSEQLNNWLNLTVGTNTGAFLRVTDQGTTNRPMRLYRARLLE